MLAAVVARDVEVATQRFLKGQNVAAGAAGSVLDVLLLRWLHGFGVVVVG